jgi:hypothetical protein
MLSTMSRRLPIWCGKSLPARIWPTPAKSMASRSAFGSKFTVS